MSGGPTPMRLRVAVVLALLAGPVAAEPASCPTLKAALEAATGSRMTAPVAGPDGDWCVFDTAVLQAEGAPDVTAARLRLRGQMTDGALAELALEAGGLRVKPGFAARDMDPALRETLRLQVADLAFEVSAGPEGLALRDASLRLSGGTELTLAADLAGAGLSSGALVVGRLTRLDLDWRNDGRLLRPGMQAWGERLVDGARGKPGLTPRGWLCASWRRTCRGHCSWATVGIGLRRCSTPCRRAGGGCGWKSARPRGSAWQEWDWPRCRTTRLAPRRWPSCLTA